MASVHIPFPGFGKESVAIIVLSKYMAKGIKCTLFFRYRNLLNDNSLYDDRIYIEFDPRRFNYQQLATQIFPEYIRAFDVYRAVIHDAELMYTDFEKSRNKNLRNTILRFYPICYYDRELCVRALKKDPEKVAENLKSMQLAQVYDDGLFINNSSHFLTTTETDLFNEAIFSLISTS